MTPISRSGFRGLYPMVYALFGADGGLCRNAMRRQVEAIVSGGVQGVSVLGMASEVNKLATIERRRLMEWVAEDLRGRLPLSVTVAEPSIQGQAEFVRAAAELGAKWVILQPPPVKGVPETQLVRFLGAVADRTPLPVAIQIAPEYLGVGLSAEALRTLNRQHANVTILKLEATAVGIRHIIDITEGVYDVFNGRAGIEITDAIRAGCVGIIPGSECFDALARIYDRMVSGDSASEAEADRLYCDLLPTLVFLMDSMDTFLVYGKRILGHRLAIAETAARPPASPPTEFGLCLARRYADALGPLGRPVPAGAGTLGIST